SLVAARPNVICPEPRGTVLDLPSGVWMMSTPSGPGAAAVLVFIWPAGLPNILYWVAAGQDSALLSPEFINGLPAKRTSLLGLVADAGGRRGLARNRDHHRVTGLCERQRAHLHDVGSRGDISGYLGQDLAARSLEKRHSKVVESHTGATQH